jgi:ribosomal protein L34
VAFASHNGAKVINIRRASIDQKVKKFAILLPSKDLLCSHNGAKVINIRRLYTPHLNLDYDQDQVTYS